ncbi:MAG: ATP-binding protein [Gemmatimonadetes bacterium]|nr:ATP-binding protein [Gemmatimonadota bacterium]
MVDPATRFATLVVGAANRLAVTAARAVVDAPGAIYNPLFVHGGAGRGKTHLLQAVCEAVVAAHPGLAVEYLAMEEFLDDLRAASQTGRSDAIKGRFQRIQLLCLDDAQLLAGQADAQSEVLRIINSMQASGRQVVMAADRPPQEIPELDARLLNRLSGGLVAEIGPPDAESREEILHRIAQARGFQFAPGVTEELARSAMSNVRELQGALNRLFAQQGAQGHPLTPQDVWPVLGEARIPARPDEFTTFLEDVTSSVAASVEAWRTHLAERIAVWSGLGYRTAILEQALALDEPPNVDELDTAFRVVTERLATLEREAIRLDPSYAGQPLFRDPDRLQEAEQCVAMAAARLAPPAGPESKWRLQDFPRTAANRPALASAQLLVLHPARVGHLMLVIGPPRSGKTHLVHGIGNALKVAAADSVVACIPAEALAREVVAAVEDGSIDRWHARYRAVQALLVEDVQKLDGRERVQQELATLADALRRDGRPVVLSCDREVAALGALSPRLRAVLESGARVFTAPASAAEAAGRFTPVPEGDEAAAPNIDAIPESEAAAWSAGPETEGAGRGERWWLDREKLVLRWPDLGECLLEDIA